MRAVRAPLRADAVDASVPAWPPPMTMTSYGLQVQVRDAFVVIVDYRGIPTVCRLRRWRRRGVVETLTVRGVRGPKAGELAWQMPLFG